MSPILIFAIALALAGALFGAERAGEHRGAAMQAQTDQKQIDKVNADLTVQKAQAGQLLAAAADRDRRDAASAASAHLQQEIQHENDQARTDVARQHLADVGRLRFDATVVDPGRGTGGGSPVPSGVDTASAAPATTVELSDETSRALGELVLEADQLADDYRECYRSWHPDWREPLTASSAAANADPGPAPLPDSGASP
jgi:hypothetical protein